MLIDPRLEREKNFPRAVQSYIFMLYEFVRELRPTNMLEIGVGQGQSTRTILLAMKDGNFGRLTSVDHKNRQSRVDEDLQPFWNFIQGDSTNQEIVEKVKESIGEAEGYDMLFIDGGHKMPTVQLDWDNYMPLVSLGGTILIHDIVNSNEQVSLMWNNIPKDWEKFGIDWGRARNGIIPGLGLVKKR